MDDLIVNFLIVSAFAAIPITLWALILWIARRHLESDHET